MGGVAGPEGQDGRSQAIHTGHVGVKARLQVITDTQRREEIISTDCSRQGCRWIVWYVNPTWEI